MTDHTATDAPPLAPAVGARFDGRVMALARTVRALGPAGMQPMCLPRFAACIQLHAPRQPAACRPRARGARRLEQAQRAAAAVRRERQRLRRSFREAHDVGIAGLIANDADLPFVAVVFAQGGDVVAVFNFVDRRHQTQGRRCADAMAAFKRDPNVVALHPHGADDRSAEGLHFGLDGFQVFGVEVGVNECDVHVRNIHATA